MRYLFVLLCLVNIGGQQLCAQQWPTENAVLHYRLVGFIAPPDNNTGELQIASGMCAEESCFAQSTIIKTPLKGGRAIVELPSFGLPYTWRIVKRVNGELQRGELMHFFVAASPGVDTSKLRMRITAHTPAANNWYVFSDELKALFDSKGRAVWFLPALPSVIDPMAMIRDLKMTPQGTITFINNDNIFEIDWNGKPLWKGPNNSNTGSSDIGVYHHEFTRLANGHYMVLTNETLCTDGKQLYKLKSPNAAQNEYNIKAGFTLRDAKGNGDGCNMYCNIAEYNQQGQLVWLWRSFPKLQHMFSADNTRIFNADTHANSFWFDAAAHMVYLSFRDCNQILKIKYPSGEIVASYGGSCTGGKTPSDTLFCGQHAVSTLRDGSLLVFNNNICHNGQKPYLLLCNQLAGNQLKPRLKIDMRINWPTEYASFNEVSPTGGGNIMQMPGGNFFVSDCPPYGDMAVVSNTHKVLWSAIAERHAPEGWKPTGQYRTAITNRAAIEKMIGHVRPQ